MANKSVKLNAVLNIIKSLLSVIFPLITYPYATRVLGVDNLGKVNYTASIITYFSLIAAFGVTTYAIREGSKVRDNKKKFNKLSSEVFFVNIISTIISYILLIILLIFSYKLQEYRLLILLQSATIIFTTFSVDWINTIFEDYFYITIRGIITNILSLIVLFIFVKTSEDYYIYALLTVLTNAVICITNLLYCRKYVDISFTPSMKIGHHVRKMSVFFINAIAVSIYVSIDTTMLGWMIGDYSVGIYSVAVKIYSIMKVVLCAIYSVALPRLSYYISQNSKNEYKDLISKVISAITILLLPMAVGLFILSKDIVLIIAGVSYSEAYRTLGILSVALVFAIFGGVVTQCINISLGKEKINVQATIISALGNILLNLIFIPWLKQDGAAITTAISEFTVLIYCIIRFGSAIQLIDKKSVIRNSLHSVYGILVVIGSGLLVRSLKFNSWSTIIGTLLVSMILYLLILIIIKNELVTDVLQKAKKRCKL